MTASAPVLDLLIALANRGVELVIKGDRLRFRPKEAITTELLELMRQHKAELLVIVSQLPATDWQTDFNERAAIMEHDGQLPREQAEFLAMMGILKQRKV